MSQSTPTDLEAIRARWRKLQQQELDVIARRIDDLVWVYGSLRKVAKVIGTDYAYLSRLRAGKKPPRPKVLAKLGLEHDDG